MKPAAFLAFSALLLFIPSCASDDEPIPVTKTGEVMKPRMVGRVATVPSDKRFILIQSYGDWKVPAGTLLVAHGSNGRTANLLATGEAMGQYAAADVQSGEVIVGDGVYSRELMKPASSDPGPSPSAAPAPAGTPVP